MLNGDVSTYLLHGLPSFYAKRPHRVASLTSALTVAAGLCVLCITVPAASAQGGWSVGLQTGINHVQSKDLASSPLAYRGYGLPFDLRVSRQSPAARHMFSVEATSSALTNAYPLETSVSSLTEWHWVRAGYGFLKPIGQAGGVAHAVGGYAELFFFGRGYDYLDGFSWEGINALYVRHQATLRRSRHTWTVGARAPLVSYLFRTDFTLDEAFLDALFRGNGLLRQGEVAWPFRDFQLYHGHLQHSYHVRPALRLTSTLAAQYHAIDDPRPSRSVSFAFMFGLHFLL